jgi:lipopolysaccharide/colanic/teichoic acid biosynthesis glycosyltransferase
LTGWAQVNGLRGQTSIVERARFDNQYIEHWSLWSDVAIMLRTAGALGRSILGRFESQAPTDVGRA